MENIIKIIADNALTVRCPPHITTSLWAYRDDWVLKENQTIVIKEEWNNRKFVRQESEVGEYAGWWYVKETANTMSTVTFNRKYDKFFAPTLQEAIELYLASKKQTI